MKIVINDCHGGFSLSDEATEQYGQMKGLNLIKFDEAYGSTFYINEEKPENYFSDRNIERNDLVLVWIVEQLAELANGFAAKLKVVEIPDDVDWQIDEYDGLEWVAEKHRTWR